MKLSFHVDLDKDLENWRGALKSHSYGMDWGALANQQIDPKIIKNTAKLRDYLKSHYYQNGALDSYKEWLEKNVDPKMIALDLEKLTGKKIPWKRIDVFITSCRRAPYNFEQKYFYIIYRENQYDKGVSGIYHELLHFIFHEYYWQKLAANRLSPESLHDLKESLTILLNETLVFRGLPEDKGYVSHMADRKKIIELWLKYKDFDKVIVEFVRPLNRVL